MFTAILVTGFFILAVVLFLVRRKSYDPPVLALFPVGWENGPADPELGDLGVALSNGSLLEFLMKKHEGGKCPVTSFWWRKKRVVSVCSPKAFKDTESLYNRPAMIFEPFFDPLHGSVSIQSVNYNDWEQQKKLLHGTIRGKNVESFFGDVFQLAQDIEWLPGKPILLLKEMFRFTIKAILSTSLGNIFEDDNSIDCLINAYHLCKCEMDKRILDVPSVNSWREKEFQKNLKVLKGYIEKMILEYNNKVKHLPLLEALVNSGWSEEKVMSNAITFLGGFHTVAYYTTWTFYYLVQNPTVQEKLWKELRERVGRDCGEELKAYTLTSKSYLRQVLDESLRMSSTVAFEAHFSDVDMIVDGYLIPAKTPIFHAIGVTMNNSDIWERPEEFNPDRFNPGTVASKHGSEFRPFGTPSRRRCPANQFTYLMVSVLLAVTVQRYVFLPSEDVVKKKYGIATSPDSDIFMTVQCRM